MTNFTNRLWHDKRFTIEEADTNEDYANLEGCYAIPEVVKGLSGDISWIYGWGVPVGSLYTPNNKRSFSKFIKELDLNKEIKFLRENTDIRAIRFSLTYENYYRITTLHKERNLYINYICVDYKDFKKQIKIEYNLKKKKDR